LLKREREKEREREGDEGDANHLAWRRALLGAWEEEWRSDEAGSASEREERCRS